MQGLIIKNREQNYLKMGNIFAIIKNEAKHYNWLITEMFYFPEHKGNDFYKNPYTWLTGIELVEKMEKDNSYWIWGVLSAFPQEIPLNTILEYPLPIADGYGGFWESDFHLQHPLASVEIVPWDGMLLLAITPNETIIKNLQLAYPFAQDLKEYNLS